MDADFKSIYSDLKAHQQESQRQFVTLSTTVSRINETAQQAKRTTAQLKFFQFLLAVALALIAYQNVLR